MRRLDIGLTRFRQDTQARIEKTANLDLIFGAAKFTGPKSVEIALPGGARQTRKKGRLGKPQN